ncbi:MAG TPA: glycosyltransferase [Vicinamibacterales bacterium]|nr:glycosyltransferase [Vicinamibacterales bacterium]
MKVAIFTDNDFDKLNGLTASLRAAVRYAPDGISPRIYTASDLPDGLPNYFAVGSLGLPVPFCGDMQMYVPRPRRFLKEVLDDGVGVIHFTTPGPVGLAGLFVAWRTRLRTVGSVHVDLAACATRLSGSPTLGAVMGEYVRWAYAKCDRVLVPSESTRQLLIGGRFAPQNVDLWTRGVDTELFNPAKRSAAVRERWRVDDRRPAIMYVGRISPEKGLGDIRRIQSALHRRGVEHRLVFVGEGPLREELQAALPDAVFTGALPPSEVAVALASADLFLLPSDTDADGSAVLEAQASGVPAIVSSFGGPKEYIRAGITGAVCPGGDLDAFGHEAAVLVRDTRRRLEMNRAAREHALTLRWERVLEPLYRAYREVAARGRGRLHRVPLAASARGNATA